MTNEKESSPPPEECPFCTPTQCLNQRDSFTCTREHGHSGNHIACGAEKHCIVSWPQEEQRQCPYCVVPGDPSCSAIEGGWSCTRPPGHTGNHVACGNREHNFFTWPQEGGSK